MGFQGNLEDLSITDMLQLLHVSRKTGTLRVKGPTGEAQLVLRNGDVTGAVHPSGKLNVGQILLQAGHVTAADIEEALRQQRDIPPRQPFIATLVKLGRIDQERGFWALSQLVEQTVCELIGWTRGTFVFEPGDEKAGDAFRHVPAQLGDPSVNMHHVLMEALRILDERNAAGAPAEDDIDRAFAEPEVPPVPTDFVPGGEELAPDAAPAESAPLPTLLKPSPTQAPAPAGPPAPTPEPAPAEDSPARLLATTPPLAMRPRRRLCVFTQDGYLQRLLADTVRRAGLSAHVTEIETDALVRVEAWMQGDYLPVVLLDVPAEADPARAVRAVNFGKKLRRQLPAVPLIVLADSSVAGYRLGFQLGARTILPRPRTTDPTYVSRSRSLLELITLCAQSIFDEQDRLAALVTRCERELGAVRKRVVSVCDRRSNTDASLLVLEHAAEHLARSAIFLVRRADLLGLSGFGAGPGDSKLASLITGLRLPLADSPFLSRIIERGELYRGEVHDPVLEAELYGAIGAPAVNEALLLPLLGPARTIALIYGDFGAEEPGRLRTDALEILASVAGLALQLSFERKLKPAGQ